MFSSIADIKSYICTQLYGFKYYFLILIIQYEKINLGTHLNGFQFSKWLYSFLWAINGTLTLTNNRI